MSGRHKFSELTKGFTAEDRRRVEAIKAEMKVSLETSDTQTQPSTQTQSSKEQGNSETQRGEPREAD